MGDSGRRASYGLDMHAHEMRAEIADAGLGSQPFVVGHSFGCFMTMTFGAAVGEQLGDVVIVDSSICSSEEDAPSPLEPPTWGNRKLYPPSRRGWRFRLMPPQPCDNGFILDYIAYHSLMPVQDGGTWKFDGNAALGARRFGESSASFYTPCADLDPATVVGRGLP